jgi:hypothetical protein
VKILCSKVLAIYDMGKTVARIEKENGIWIARSKGRHITTGAHSNISKRVRSARSWPSPFDIDLFLKPVRGQLTIFALAKNSELVHQLPKKLCQGRATACHLAMTSSISAITGW